MLDACLLDSQLQFLHQDVDNRPFQRGCNVLLVVLYEVGIVLHPLAHIIKERCLQT